MRLLRVLNFIIIIVKGVHLGISKYKRNCKSFPKYNQGGRSVGTRNSKQTIEHSVYPT